jgi:AcrR family transcriptional regulator
MPKKVDHDQRRAAIAALVVDVIQGEGAESATVRRVSQKGGFSVGVITHYFRDKDELIASAFGWLAAQSFAGLESALAAQAPGLARLRAALEFMVPVTGARSFPAVWLSLWSGAMHNPRLAEVHRHYYGRWRLILARALRDAVARREAPLPTDVGDTVDLLVAGVDGLWIATTFEAGRFSRARRRRLVANLLAAVLGLPSTAHP